MPLDLNSDLGEGFGAWTMGDDAAMLDIVTSANIACGFHAGDPSIMRRTCEVAVAKGVRIGAHIGYRDQAGFGRRAIAMDPADLRDEILYQIGGLDTFARIAGDRVRYVKPHGALYHSAAADRSAADAVVGALVEFGAELALLGPADSQLEQSAAAAGLRFVGEGFADRAYTPRGTLAPRGTEGAVLHANDAVAQAVSIATSGRARGVDGREVKVTAKSICVHGDTPAAVEMARRIRESLHDVGVPLESFA
ncbi:LamB/YcsF family protein [Nocardia bovistercoris]|uniref:5-oxoprolinase subunit A n=1 Tax=Nocardia bovistercoris TaxID=2785916 RepID=A0A931N411_9NOCA|nr:5-oxoprolinase subunit PxpA [Nocardia bovistercoris]MBH0781235.1 LamB/YcsF family protein [Nocardia bovistercoris]